MRKIYPKSILNFHLLFFILLHSTYSIGQNLPNCHTQTEESASCHSNLSGKEKKGKKVLSHSYFQKMKILRDTSHDGNSLEIGSWETVIPKDDGAAIGRILGMQTVHNVMLPSGKILISSGSSWRNYKDIQYYPEYKDPAPAMGLFNLYDNPFRNSLKIGDSIPNFRKENYYNLVNNTAIYDPSENTFYRIPHPVPVDAKYPDSNTKESEFFVPSDLFCSGHLQLPNGNPLFVGGTQYYFPYRTGTNSSFIFDWKKELEMDWKRYNWKKMPENNKKDGVWKFSGFMKRGRWYPSIVPLLDGRMVIFSGFVGFDTGYPTMYRFEINPYIEFFDPYQFDLENPQKAWKSVNAKKALNSPFTTLINTEFVKSPCVDHEFHTYWESESCDNNFPLPCECDTTCERDNAYDAFKLYPNNYLINKNQIYLTREGDWVSLRTADAAYMRKTKKTYLMTFNNDVNSPKVEFSHGPDRKDTITSYGTSYLDPNTNKITILGGQATSPGTLLPLDSKNPTQFAGGRGSRKREEFWFNEQIFNESKWNIEKGFLGDNPQEDRTMLTAIILPTKDVLIINGGNYDFYGPVLYPILLSPHYDEKGKFIRYTKRRMSDAVEPRLYHNSAMLLPDGRILVSGGNSARASVSSNFKPSNSRDVKDQQSKPNLNQVDLDMYFFRDGQMAKAQKGMQYTPTENWTAELFSPPYIHIEPNRKIEITNIKEIKRDRSIVFNKKIGNKEYYLLQSNKTYKVNIRNVTTTSVGDKKPSLVLIKLASFTHNWNNGQFFVDLDIVNAKVDKGECNLHFKAPNMQDNNIPPGYYMMYYVDNKGKPSIAQMVRFDDKAKTP